MAFARLLRFGLGLGSGSGGGSGSGIVNNRIDGDLTIGEDSTDLMVVNSKTKFSNDLDVGTDLIVSKTISAKNVNEDIRNKAYTLNNKIDTQNDSWTKLGQDLVGDDPLKPEIDENIDDQPVNLENLEVSDEQKKYLDFDNKRIQELEVHFSHLKIEMNP